MTALQDDLARIVGAENVSTTGPDRSAYAHDLWPRQLLALRAGVARPEGPAAIVWPTRDEHLSQLLELARKSGLRLAPFGAGSGVVGALQLDRDTIAVDLKRMRALHSVDLEAGTATADAGILGQHLEDALSHRGATLGHFPSSIYCSTLGGWVVTRSAGQCSGRYGKIEDMTLAVEGVLPTGEPFRAGPPAAGARDLRPLLVGSEGLFGFATRATMRVWPKPVARPGRAFTFATTREAWEAQRALYQAGLRPAVARIYDPFDSFIFRSGHKGGKKSPSAASKRLAGLRESVARRVLAHPRWINTLSDRFAEHLWGRTLLILVWEQAPGEDAQGELERATAMLRARGARDEGSGFAERWLQRRHSVGFRMSTTFEQGLWVDTMEVSARWSRFEALYLGVREALGQGGFVMAHMSHAYPDGGSIYFTFAGADPKDERALDTYLRTWRNALAAAHAAGGSISHHHGVGRSKRAAMRLETGASVDVLQRLARAADPHGVMLQGALVPTDEEALRAPEPSFGEGIELDEDSRLALVDASQPVGALQQELARRGFELRSFASEGTVEEALRVRTSIPAERDPVEHAVAGWKARTPEGAHAWWVPAPRRAAGPDLLPLWLDPERAFGTLQRVALRVHRRGDEGARYAPPLAPPQGESSESLTQWLARARG